MSLFSVCIDWLRFTLPFEDDVKEVLKRFPGTFTPCAGASSYRKGYVQNAADGGVIRVLYGREGAPKEVHVDCSGGVTSRWDYQFIQELAKWATARGAKSGRVDIAFDDHSGGVPVKMVEDSVRAGQCVKRSKTTTIMERIYEGTGEVGRTLYFGSRQSDTFLRVYDKRAQLIGEGEECKYDSWVRWEVELKNERSRSLFRFLPVLAEDDFRGFSIGLLRSSIDFRDTDHRDESWDRTRAAVLPWWEELTGKFRKARLIVREVVKKIADVKAWAARSLAPMLAVLAASPDAGEKWILDMIVTGPDRWQQKHYDLLRRTPKGTYVLREKHV